MKFIKTATTFAVFVAVALLSGCGSLDLKKEGEASFVNGPKVSTMQRERDNGSKFCEVLVDGKLKGTVEGECGPTLAMYDALHRQQTAVARPQVLQATAQPQAVQAAGRYTDNVVRPTAKTLHGYEPGTKADGAKFCRLYFTDNSTLEIPIQGNTCAELSDVINALQSSGAQQRVTYVDQPEERVVRTASQQVVYQQPAQQQAVASNGITAGNIAGGAIGAVVGYRVGDRACKGNGLCEFLSTIGFAALGVAISQPSLSAPGIAPGYGYGNGYYPVTRPYYNTYYGAPGLDRAALDLDAQAASYRVRARNQRFNNCSDWTGAPYSSLCQRGYGY